MRSSSSNGFGVTTSASGTSWSRNASGIPSRTYTPRPTSPMTGSQQKSAPEWAARIRATASATTWAVAASPR